MTRAVMCICGVLFGQMFCEVPGQSAHAQEHACQAGLAKVDITPEYPIRLNGFGFRRDESEGVTQPIWAKALAVRHGEDPPVVVLAIDSLGIRESMVNEVARRLHEKQGLPRERLAVTFSHSHTTPKVNGACDTIFSSPIPAEHQEHIDRYTRELTDALEKAALLALQDLRPAELAWSIGKVEFAKNRRTAEGPVDHDLPMLVVKDMDGAIRGIYVSYACHCVTLSNNKISGDWSGFAQEMIERAHPGCVALLSIGCGSDSNPLSGVAGDKVDVAADQGGQIAREVERLLQQPLRPIRGPVKARLVYVDLPLQEPPSREQLEQLAQQSTPAGYNAQFQLHKLDRGESLVTELHYPIQAFTFGDDLQMAFLAGEICVDYAKRLKVELAGDRIWLNGYSNDFCAYIPSERLLLEGGYGGGGEVVYFALPSTLQTGLEEKIIEAVKQLTPESFFPPPGTHGVPPREPDEALKSFQLGDDLRIELVASEPLLADPVAIDFGPDGRLWVVEMPDYSREVDESFEGSGRVKFLEDHDGDGTFDSATLFLDKLRFPTGVTVWRKGVLICDAPHILYAEDTNGDGRADVTRELYSGFATHNPHARVNSLRYGLDNWVYGSGGLFGGTITSFAGGTAQLNRTDFRINPDTGAIEAATGVTQQGRARDDWDNWFGCDNGGLAFHYPVYDHYVRRNRFVAPPAPQINVPADAEAERLYPPGELVLFKLSGNPGRATAACGLEIYRDELLGDEFASNCFTCEPVHQAVHRLILTREGAVFRGRRAPDEPAREFLASTDQWFRPVQVRTGPDGALWVVDMYRYVIEHKRWIPQTTLAQLDVFAGQTRGRIYRIYRADRRPREIPIVSELSAGELVTLLDHPNGVLRDMAQQQLRWRQQRSASPALLEVALHGKVPAGRAQALNTLDGLQDALPDDTLRIAMRDEHAGVRRAALRIAETRLDSSPPLLEAAVRLAGDEAYEVRLQAAYSLGFTNSPQAATALANLARQYPGDGYLQAAVKSSLHEGNITRVLQALREHPDAPRLDVWLSYLSLAVQVGDGETLAYIVQTLTSTEAEPRWRFDALRHVLEGAQQVRTAERIGDFLQQPALRAWVDAARMAAADSEVDAETRVAAIRLVARCPVEDRLALLASLLSPQHVIEVQTAAAEAIGHDGSDDAARALVGGWNSATPTLRRLITDLLLQRPGSADVLLTAMEQKQVAANSLDAPRRQRLLEHNDESIRSRAQTLFQTAGRSNRLEVLARYADAARQDGDAALGQVLFRKHCAACHKLGDVGFAVGPDLAALVNKSPEYLLVAILDPHRVVEERYQSYAAQTVDGRIITGMLANETSASVTLVEQEGKTHVLLRRDIELLQATGKSLMPEGLENDVAPQQLADLITLLMKLGPESASGK